MASARNNTCANPNEYQQQRDANIAIRDAKLQALNIPRLRQELNDQPKKTRRKRTYTAVAETEARNLRPRPPRDPVENAKNANEETDEDLDCEPIGDFLCANHVQNSHDNRRQGRGITKMKEVFSRAPDMPKVKALLNEYYQPVGSRELASVIGVLARKISVQYSDWRLVDVKKKEALWKEIKDKYNIPTDGMHWILKTAGKKWKDFKAELKKQYFNDEITNEELKKKYGDRVNESDWEYLITHWMSPEFEVRKEIAKANRSKLAIHHRSGTKSFARVRHELGRKLGRPARRYEVYFETHTTKTGVPAPDAEPIINKIKEVIEAHPELKERTIEQGDALAAACGAKEPRGSVRTLGLGPTPQDVAVAGLKCFPSTRFQMEVLARKTAEERIAELEDQMKRQEERHAEERQNFMEVMSHGSNSRPRSINNVDDAHHHYSRFHEDEDYGDNEDHDACPEDGDYLFLRRRPAALAMQSCQNSPNSATHTVQTHATSPLQRNPNDTTAKTALVAQHLHPLSNRFSNKAAPTVQHGIAHEVQPNATSSHQCVPKNAAPIVQQCVPNNAAPTVQQCVPNNATPTVHHAADQGVQPDAAQRAKPVQPQVGMKVILYAMVRSNIRVALGTIVSTNPKDIVGGVALGKQYCEVIVTHVLQKDATLPRTYPGVEKMSDAECLSIAWPYNKVKQMASKPVWKASKPPQGVSAGGGMASGVAAGGEKS